MSLKVYKYRGGNKETIKRDLSSLIKNQIYSAPIGSLNDPFEAKIKLNNDSFSVTRALSLLPHFKSREKIKDAELKLINALEKFIETTKSWGIYSLSKTYQDELLWSYYGDSHRGFCIEYDLHKLKEYKINTEPHIDVNYQDDIPEISLSDMFLLDNNKEKIQRKFIATKSKRWKHENEIRIITGQTGLYEYDFRALKAIYFGYRSSERFRKLTMRLLKGRSIKYYQMQPIEGTYKLKRHEIADPFHNAPLYMSGMAEVEDSALLIDNNLKPYEKLIKGAIEVAKREPYCETIIGAYISSSKGTKDDPVFYVTYIRKDGLTTNMFISKSDIISKGYH